MNRSEIRVARSSDSEGIRKLIWDEAYIRFGYDLGADLFIQNEMPDKWSSKIQNHMVLVAESETGIEGVINLVGSNDSEYKQFSEYSDWSHIHDFYFIQSDTDIKKHLLLKCIEKAKNKSEKGIVAIRRQTYWTHPLDSLYAECGFVRIRSDNNEVVWLYQF